MDADNPESHTDATPRNNEKAEADIRNRRLPIEADADLSGSSRVGLSQEVKSFIAQREPAVVSTRKASDELNYIAITVVFPATLSLEGARPTRSSIASPT